MKSPLAMKYSGGETPKGVQALNKGKTKSSDMPPKKMKPSGGGNYYKEAPTMRTLGAHKDMSSGATGPTKQASSDKDRYKGVEQPLQYSNGMSQGRTKFVC